MANREVRFPDWQEMPEPFLNTVARVNAEDFKKGEPGAWGAGSGDLAELDRSLQAHFSVVAEEDGVLAGFGDIDGTGYLDRLYVHYGYQGRGIAAAVCDRLEGAVQGNVVTHASITARPFFEKRGYRVVKEQQVERNGVFLTNFVMVKRR